MAEWFAIAALAALVAVVWLLRRPTGAERELARQNAELHDLCVSLLGEGQEWLRHRRELARLEADAESDRVRLRMRAAPEDRPMEIAGEGAGYPDARIVGMPTHGGMP